MDAECTASPLRLQRTEDTSDVDAVSSAACTFLFASEPALLETVVGFIAVDEDEHTREKKDKKKTQFGRDTLFATIVALCRAFPTLGQRFGPLNQGFWRKMVLRRFDFTVSEDETFNVADYDDKWQSRGPEESTHPIRQAIAEYQATHPNNHVDDGPDMLEHDLAYWEFANFRPTEYGFLSDIQEGKSSMATWPDHEDAYTLYRDLALLHDKLSKLENLQTWSEGGNEVFPCLLSRMDGDVVDGGHELFKHCDFLPFYWDGCMHKRWSGFDHPLPPTAASDQTEWKLRTAEEKAIFPKTPKNRKRFECLRRVVHESFSDWRRLHANGKGGYYQSVEFFIGKSKLSGRWLGFVGESDFNS